MKVFFKKENIFECLVVFLKMEWKTSSWQKPMTYDGWRWGWVTLAVAMVVGGHRQGMLMWWLGGLQLGVEVRLISFKWGRKWKRKSILAISAFILWSTGKQFWWTNIFSHHKHSKWEKYFLKIIFCWIKHNSVNDKLFRLTGKKWNTHKYIVLSLNKSSLTYSITTYQTIRL